MSLISNNENIPRLISYHSNEKSGLQIWTSCRLGVYHKKGVGGGWGVEPKYEGLFVEGPVYQKSVWPESARSIVYILYKLHVRDNL